MRVEIAGKEWLIQDAKLCGLCEHEAQIITIQVGQRGKARLDTVIHEVVHACQPLATELAVAALAKVVTEILWRDGWRRKNG